MGMLLLQSKPACMHAAWHAAAELKLADAELILVFLKPRARDYRWSS
jgi:hypothetical protein